MLESADSCSELSSWNERSSLNLNPWVFCLLKQLLLSRPENWEIQYYVVVWSWRKSKKCKEKKKDNQNSISQTKICCSWLLMRKYLILESSELFTSVRKVKFFWNACRCVNQWITLFCWAHICQVSHTHVCPLLLPWFFRWCKMQILTADLSRSNPSWAEWCWICMSAAAADR